MKRFVIIGIGLLAMIALPVAAQTSTMKFSEDMWDFGTVKEEDGKLFHTFTFTNNGDKPFVIEDALTTCGCMIPRYSKEPILPGKSGTIEVVYDPDSRPGAFRREVVVVSNGRTNRNTITITGTVIPKPKTVADYYPLIVAKELRVNRTSSGLGYVPRGGTKSSTMEYYNNSQQPLTLGVVYEGNAPYLNVSFDPATIAPGKTGVMTTTYDLSKTNVWGMLSNKYYLTVNGEKAATTFFATGIATDDFTQYTQTEMEQAAKAVMQSQFHHFGDMKPTSVQSHNFTIVNQGKQPLIIRSIQPGERIKTTLQEEKTILPGESVSFSVSMDLKGAPKGRLMQSLVVIVNDPQRPMREIRLAANIQ